MQLLKLARVGTRTHSAATVVTSPRVVLGSRPEQLQLDFWLANLTLPRVVRRIGGGELAVELAGDVALEEARTNPRAAARTAAKPANSGSSICSTPNSGPRS